MLSAEDIQDTFNFYDAKGDGKIAASQIPGALRSLHLSPSEELIGKMTKQWEKTPDARISIPEFTPIYNNVAKECGKAPSLTEFQTLLSHFDREGNGYITIVELRQLLENSGEKLTAREVDSLLFGYEVTDGKIQIADFLRHHLMVDA